MTVKNSDELWFRSNDQFFIEINGMRIFNNTNYKDYACLSSSFWEGILVGTDGYPTKPGYDYCIAGGKDTYFKATAIEFYGVKTKI